MTNNCMHQYSDRKLRVRPVTHERRCKTLLCQHPVELGEFCPCCGRKNYSGRAVYGSPEQETQHV